ncbi:heat shock 70 kDa protein 12A-like [Alosa pseudoharengus]|uniref:heat shock 70 kDa protein 12A-like n=1 Tax=Alosa pseudoharengus TaxID=34774 RepID=UPI003F89F446
MSDSLLYIAIDFGTAYSGYGVKTNLPGKGSQLRDAEWGAEYGIRSCKTPTCVMFDSDGNFQCFGYAAMKKYTKKASLQGNEYFFSNFKMELYKNKDIKSDLELTALHGGKMAAVKVFAESLRYLKDHALSKIQNYSEAVKLQESDVTWVLTVPAIWSNAAKEFMRKAAIQAGLVTESEPDRLILALEPEAASVYCKQLPSDGFVGGEKETLRLDQNSGTQYIVADCGGGTIDITVHEVLNGGMLKEVYKASGNDLGGQIVDRELKSFLREICGDKCWEEYENKHPQEVQKFMYEFASAKCAEENESISFPCSFNLSEIVKKHRGQDVESLFQGSPGVKWNDGAIEISSAKFRSFFDGSFRGIAKILKEIMKKPELHIDYLLLVGGYASSKILQDYMKGQFGSKCQVLCPLHPQEAVMIGAVEFGMRPEVVVSRICALTYGIAVAPEFDESKHRPEKKYMSSDGVAHCNDCFERLVKRDESVGYKETRSYTYFPVSSDQTSMSIRFYSTTRLNAEYVDEWGMDKIGSITVPMPDIKGGLKRQVRLDICFGSTEITATVTDMTSKITKTTTIDFMRK